MKKWLGKDGTERTSYPRFGGALFGSDTKFENIADTAETLAALLAEQKRTNELLERVALASERTAARLA